MESLPIRPIDFQRPVPRTTVLTLLKAALDLGEARFARQTALAWLAVFPGDLQVNYNLAKALFVEGNFAQAATILNGICMKDPEFFEAQELRANAQITPDPLARALSSASVVALGGIAPENFIVPEWSLLLRKARQAIQVGMLDQAEEYVQQAIHENPQTPLPAIFHVEITRKKEDIASVNNMADVYHIRWTECLQFSLYLAEARMRIGDDTTSVALLHHCVSHDSAGQVPSRIWGINHPYRPLWTERMQCIFDLPIPAAVAGSFGWNQLPQGVNISSEDTGEKSVIRSIPSPKDEKAALLSMETLNKIQDEFDRIAQRLRRPEVTKADGRYPVYVILSTRHGLEGQFGPQTTAVLGAEMKNIAEMVRRRPQWGSMVFFADDSECTSAFGIKPAPSGDPKKIKMTLNELDKALGKKGQMIGALLIVGGPQVVPYHYLPNPADDDDKVVPSDNPYASLSDENFFIPEWQIGRLPSGNSSDAGMLLTCLRRIAEHHSTYTRQVAWWKRNWIISQAAKTVKSIIPSSTGSHGMKPSFGYTAAVWKKSSVEVFRPISENQRLLVSPPARSGNVPKGIITPAYLNYYNLHGLQDSAEWYGQRESSDTADGPDYPVALSPNDVITNNQSPKMIFSEACYGANIEGKDEDSSLALKFLSSGTQIIVGSTCISYGSVTTPLIAADLVGNSFWKLVKTGHTAGEAFQLAKSNLVCEMNKRQGYLDGEDQKTLISFILFGDPLAAFEPKPNNGKVYLRMPTQPAIVAFNDSQENYQSEDPIPDEMATKVKKVVDRYLPDLEDAEFHFSQMHAVSATVYNGSGNKNVDSKRKVQSNTQLKHTHISMSKQVVVATHTHRHFARLTLDKNGKMVKIAVSR